MNQKKLDNWLNKKLEPYKKKYGDNYIQMHIDKKMPNKDLVDINMIFEEDALNHSIGNVPDEVESKIVKQSQDQNFVLTSAPISKPPLKKLFHVNESVNSVMSSYHNTEGVFSGNNTHGNDRLIEELKQTIKEEMQGNKEENA